MKKIFIILLLFPLFAFGDEINCLLPDGTRFESLVPAKQINAPYHLRIDPRDNLFFVSEGVCVNLSKKDSPVIAFPQSFSMTDVSWLKNGDCLFSDKSNIYYRNEECDSVLMLVHTKMNNIQYKASDYGIYFYDKDSTELFFFSYPKAQIKKVCQFALSINDISIFGDAVFVAYGDAVCIISSNAELVKLFKNKTPITALAVNDDKTLFYGTSEGLYYYDNEDRQFKIANGNIADLLISKNCLYLQFADGASAKIHNISEYRKSTEGIIKHFDKDKSNTGNLSDARSQLVKQQFQQSMALYSQMIRDAEAHRSASDGVSGDLLAEYAYALALHHDFEAAMMNIDRARVVGTKYGDFYAAQILTLMGYDVAAKQLMQKAEVPEWINDTYQTLNAKRKTTASINQDAPDAALKRANKLAANRQTIQSIALFEELATVYPNEFIVYVDYSTVWESLGNYDYAAKLLQKGIDLMPQEDSANKQTFANHLVKVNQMKANAENSHGAKLSLGGNRLRMMTYVGASIAKDVYSMNGRFGLYTNNRFSASLNVGVNYMAEQFYGSVGVSAYKTWKVFVCGLGITDMFGHGSNTISLTPSVGLSFLNKSQTASFDIMINGYVPFSSGQKFSYGISIGRTFYFDLNGLKK